MRVFARGAASAFLLFLLFGNLGAQQTGEIRGNVVEKKGEALPGVAVKARSPNLHGSRTAASDRAGYFRLPPLPVGTYSLTFELSGFEKLTMTGTDVRLGFTSHTNNPDTSLSCGCRATSLAAAGTPGAWLPIGMRSSG
jgi:hypothetical protein